MIAEAITLSPKRFPQSSKFRLVVMIIDPVSYRLRTISKFTSLDRFQSDSIRQMGLSHSGFAHEYGVGALFNEPARCQIGQLSSVESRLVSWSCYIANPNTEI